MVEKGSKGSSRLDQESYQNGKEHPGGGTRTPYGLTLGILPELASIEMAGTRLPHL